MGPQHSSSIDLGNKRGKNSVVGDPIQGDGLVPGGGGAKIKFMKHLPNGLSYLLKSLRDVTGAVGQYESIKSIFDSENTEREIDSITKDSIFQHTPIEIDSTYIKHYQLERMEWGVEQPKKFQPDSKKIWIIRKDSAKKTNSIRRSYDSVKKSLGFDD